MEILQFIEEVIGVQNFPLVSLIIKGVLIYVAVLWLAVVIWVARDVIERSNSLIFQVIMILMNIGLPVFGLMIYLIIRPSKTILERYYEEMEYKLLAESNTEESTCCPRCDESLKAEYIFCPGCQEKIKNTCKHCKQNFTGAFNVCPFCGKKQAVSEKKKKEKKGEE